MSLPVPSIALPVPSIALPVGMQYDASVTGTIQRRSQSSGATDPAAQPIGAANPAVPPIQWRSQSSGAVGRRRRRRRRNNFLKPPAPVPITPRDNISRSGTHPHSDVMPGFDGMGAGGARSFSAVAVNILVGGCVRLGMCVNAKCNIVR